MQLTVPSLKNPKRLDLFLKEQFPHLSRRSFQKLIVEDLRVNGKKSRKGQLLRGKEILEWEETLFTPSYVEDTELKIKVVLEDKDFLVVEKPAGIPTHPLKNTEKGTLIQGVFAQFPETRVAGPLAREGGLIHRLDNETSGLVLVARHSKAYQFLKNQFRQKKVVKEYLAVVEKKPFLKSCAGKWVSITSPIAHDSKNRKKMKIDSKGRAAITYVKFEKGFKKNALVRLRIITGVRHQIRVHLASVGLPLVGDLLYKGEGILNHKGFFLHAHRLEFLHPSRFQKVCVESPLPPNFQNYRI